MTIPVQHIAPSLSLSEIRGLIDLGGAVMALGEVLRQCRHPDGVTVETDTTHTVMLAVVAGTLAERLYPHLDQGRLMWAAFGHDFVEIVVGDTMTWDISAAERMAKAEREAFAARELAVRFGDISPRLVKAILSYENLDTPEDRLVKTVDKVLPKITHLLNDGVVLRNLSTAAEADVLWREQRESMRTTYAADFPEVLDLFTDLASMVRTYLD